MSSTLFFELTLVFGVVMLLSGLMKVLRQPLIIGYIASGIVVGPFFFDILKSTESIAAFSQMGVAFLLFIVGLSLNPKIIKEVGKVSLIIGIGQVLFTSIIGYFIGKALGLSSLSSLYVAVALTFSSTIIIMKLLSDRNDVETLYGKIAIGFLIVQDLIAVIILMAVSSLSNGTSIVDLALASVLKGGAVIIILIFIGVYVLPRLTKWIAQSQEFLLLFSVGWCFALAALFNYLHFSIEVGALIAGITLSISPYHYEIGFKMRPLRDFFIVIFFLSLGAQMILGNISQYLIPTILFSLFILIGNPLIVLILMGLLGYTRRTSFMCGLTVAQISEFSLILIALGVQLGHVSNEILSLVTLVGLITIAGSTYMIMYADKLYFFLSPYLRIFERKGNKIDEQKYYVQGQYGVILFGYNRVGFELLESLKKTREKILVVDHDPETIIKLAKEGQECRYGDANDMEMLQELNISKTKMLISTIPSFETNLLLITTAKKRNRAIITIVVSHQIEQAIRLYKVGATYVLLPHFVGAKYVSTLIDNYGFNRQQFLKEKISHLDNLNKRKLAGHEHPH